MSFEVRSTSRFEKSAKALAKKYRSFKTDLKEFVESLAADAMQGDELTPGVRKIRMAITSKGRGKSGAARVITFNVLTAEQEGRVYLLEIYDKADFSTVDVNVLKQVIETMQHQGDLPTI